jgi:hypothetical protein
VWPRDPAALDSFVDELEDQGMYGAGRTLVVPATEAEREIACSFAVRLAEAPWLATAILDVGDIDRKGSPVDPLVTPAPAGPQPSPERRRRLSSQASPSVIKTRVVTTPSSRPPRKKTVVGLPAVQASAASSDSPVEPAPSTAMPVGSSRVAADPAGSEVPRRQRNARATIRMVVPANDGSPVSAAPNSDETAREAEAFLLTRPVPVTADNPPAAAEPEAPYASSDARRVSASTAVMRAAVRLLGGDDEEIAEVRPSQPSPRWTQGQVRGVALAWNGPLSGPVLRRAARLAHRVMVVVSSGVSGVDLARVRTRLGRGDGVGYVLVNVADAYVDLEDRVGPVEAFWKTSHEGEPAERRLR